MLPVCLLLLLLLLPTAAPSPSAYEALTLHGLPIGLFPKGIDFFHLDAPTGRFQFLLPSPCNARFENDLHYEANVSGTISYGRIGDLSGMSAQDLFLWLPVKDVRVDVPSSGVIYFDVGVVRKRFSLGMFDVPPDCYTDDVGDGGGADRRVLRKNVNVLNKDIYGKAIL